MHLVQRVAESLKDPRLALRWRDSGHFGPWLRPNHRGRLLTHAPGILAAPLRPVGTGKIPSLAGSRHPRIRSFEWHAWETIGPWVHYVGTPQGSTTDATPSSGEMEGGSSLGKR